MGNTIRNKVLRLRDRLLFSIIKEETNKTSMTKKPEGIFYEFFKKHPKWKKPLKISGIVCIAFIAFIAFIFIYYAKDLPSSEEILSGRFVAQATQIYDRTGQNLLFELHGEENRTMIKLDDLPKYMPEATIAIEDDAFYKHPGFDINGIIRASWKNLTGQKGEQGGSTITQQLIKNTILTPEKTYSRKFKELILSLELEMKLKKDEILELYLNAIPYGSNAYGVEAASNTYFDKSAKDLTLPEAAMIAGLPKAPTYYSPYIHPDRAKERQKEVLDRMASTGYITREKADEAFNIELAFAKPKISITAPHFVFYIKEILEEKYGLKKTETGGLKVYTTLDLDKQRIAEEVTSDHVDRLQGYGAHNSALVSMNPKTGEILAMVGSVDYFADKEAGGKLDGKVNVITSYRAPGSSFKPVDYVTAFKQGYPPTTILYDVRTNFGSDGSGKDYIPSNYSGGFSGPVSIRTALQQSLNIPAIKAYYLAGPENVSTMAHNLGYSNFVPGKAYGLSTAVGSKEVTPLEHLGSLDTFANRGHKKESTGILRIEDSSGKVLEELNKSQGEKIIDENIADTINDVLSDNSARSWGKKELTLKNRPVAAKTGTSNKDVGNGRILPDNNWTIGYTPNLSAVVWVGNNDGSVMSGGATGVNDAAPIWNDYMSRASEGMPVEEFVKPELIPADKPILLGRTGGAVDFEICKPSNKLATENCPASMREKRTYRDVHCILYYVIKDDPNGPYPKNLKEDPQYTNWESGVRAWANAGGGGEAPPTEEDTLHNPENWPKVNITSPESGSAIENSSFFASANASGANPIKRVDFYIDGTRVGSDSSSPYSANITLPAGIVKGFHTLSAKAYDNIENIGETSINIDVRKDDTSATIDISITQPSGGSTLSSFPITVGARASGTYDISRVDFFVKPTGGSAFSIGGDSTNSNGNFGAGWSSKPAPGSYSIYAIATDKKGNSGTSSSIPVTVK